MRKKNVLMLLSIVLIIVLVCMFVACDDKNGNNNVDNNNGTVNGLPSIILTEDMSLDEVKEALEDVQNLTVYYGNEEYSSAGLGMTVYIAENGYISADHYYGGSGICWYYEVKAIEDTKVYSLYRELTDSLDETNYAWHAFAEDDETVMTIKKFKEKFFESLFNSVETGEATMNIKDGTLILTYQIDENNSVSYTLYDFNKTTLPIAECCPDYKPKAVEKVEEA